MFSVKRLIFLLAVMVFVVVIFGVSAKPVKAYNPTELVVNGGFEADPLGYGWVTPGATTDIGAHTPHIWHGGSRGTDLSPISLTHILYQTVLIPSNATSVVLSAWYQYYATYGIEAYPFVIKITNPSDETEVYAELRPDLEVGASSWRNAQIDLTAFKGRNVKVQFWAYGGPVYYVTGVYIDDVSIIADFLEPAPAPAPSPTPAPEPTPTPVPISAPAPIPKVLGVDIGTPFIVTGTKKGGGPEVRVLTTAGKLLKSFNAYPDTFRGGINVAVGDINGDGASEIITSTREGGVPTIKVFSPEGKNLGWDFDAYDSKFRGGISIAVGDLNNDGLAEIVTAPLGGGGPNVRIFGLRNGKIIPVMANFFAYDKNFRGGTAVSIGDINGDGQGEIITTPTSRGGPHIRIFGLKNNKYVPITPGIMAYAPTFRGGINSCVGDVNNDGKDEVITGIVSAGGPHVRIFGIKKDGTFGLLDPGFMAYNTAFRGGISVASIDVNDDGYDEIITGVGGNGNPTVRIFNQSGKQVSKEFNAYSTNYKNGITLAAGYF